MGGETLTQSPLRGGVRDAGRTHEKVAEGREKGGEGRDNDGGGEDDGERGDYGVSDSDGAYGGGQLGNGSGTSTYSVPGGETGGEATWQAVILIPKGKKDY